MKIETLRLSNFQCFGPDPTAIDLEDITYFLGPNGSGKTAVLEALCRLFSPSAALRAIKASDFHLSSEDTASPSTTMDPTLWIETELVFPEASADEQHASIPPFFSQMTLDSPTGPPRVRVRLTASLAADNEVDEQINYVVRADEAGEPLLQSAMSRFERGSIEVHYLPARRDPADQITYAAHSLIGRTLRAVDWTNERSVLNELTTQVTATLRDNGVVGNLNQGLTDQWTKLHKSQFLANPALSFGRGDFEGALRLLTLDFSPSHRAESLSFDLLSDGQKSLLYISLVRAWQNLAQRVTSGTEKRLDADKLHPPVHTFLAIEEPENSLSPHLLGRIKKSLTEACERGAIQVALSTHSSSLLRRVDPQRVRFLRLSDRRETTVARVTLPDTTDTDAEKYVREAVKAYPELYFSRLVVLGEGASEQVVIPRVLACKQMEEDESCISVVPLGGRHVNHFWRLLNDLRIPYVTLLDLDAGRHAGGWGRIKYAMEQVDRNLGPTFGTQIADLPQWNDGTEFPAWQLGGAQLRHTIVAQLEEFGVFFSAPIDLDMLMLEAYPQAYGAKGQAADGSLRSAVLGAKHHHSERLPKSTLSLFSDYNRLFKLASKPTSHLQSISTLNDEDLHSGLPPVLERLATHVSTELGKLPE